MQEKVIIVAELSANHNQSKKTAIDSIIEARRAGADAVKLQTYTADTLTINCDNKWFRIGGGTLWDGKTLYELYKAAYTPWEWHQELFETAHKEGLICFSTPFDFTAVDFLEELNNPIYKVASFEITDIPLIRYMASKGKKMVISTGIASYDDIERAIQACKDEGNSDLVLLKCTSSYPAPIDEANLLSIPLLRSSFGFDVGLSDHTIGDIAAIAATSLGATMIEKHFILDRKMGGPDAGFSMEPDEFSLMVSKIRDVEAALGSATFDLSEGSLEGRKFARSLFVVEDIKQGELFSKSNIKSIRPGYGLSPSMEENIIGKRATRDILRGTPLSHDMIN